MLCGKIKDFSVFLSITNKCLVISILVDFRVSGHQLQQDHLSRAREILCHETVEVNTRHHRLARLVSAVSGDLVVSGGPNPVAQPGHRPAGHIIYAQLSTHPRW
jgi:hypothetical protein